MNNEQRDRFYAIAERFCQEHAEDIIDVYRYPPVPEAQLIATRGLRGFDAVSCIECAVLPLGGLSEREECNRVYLRKLWRAASRSSRTEL